MWAAFERRLVCFCTAERARIYTRLAFAVLASGYLVSVLLGPLLSGGPVDLAGSVVGADFVAFYGAGSAVLSGHAERLYDLHAQATFVAQLVAPASSQGDVYPFVSPPYLALLLVPLAVLPYPLALLVFWGGSAAALVSAVSLLRAELPELAVARGTWQWSWLTLGFFPVSFAFFEGQFSPLLLLDLTATWICLRRKLDFRGGAVLGLLALKPQLALGPVIVLLVTGRLRALLGVACTAGLLLLLGWWLLPSAMLQYVLQAPQLFAFLRQPGYQTWGQASLFGLAAGLLDPIAPRAGSLLAITLTLAGVVLLAALARRWRARVASERWDLGWATCWALGLLVAPHLFLYDVSLFVLPLAIVFARIGAGQKGNLLDSGPVLAAVALLVATCFVGPPLARLLQQVVRAAGFPAPTLQPVTLAALLFTARLAQRAESATP